jgi:hypothetical protein
MKAKIFIAFICSMTLLSNNQELNKYEIKLIAALEKSKIVYSTLCVVSEKFVE